MEERPNDKEPESTPDDKKDPPPENHSAETEAKEVLSPKEIQFDKERRTIGLFLGPAAAIAIYFVPISGLSPEAHTLAAILTWVVLWWVTEPVPLPITAMLGAILSVIAGVAPAKTVLAPFADPIIFLFMGSFVIARAMMLHGLDRRFAYAILSMKWIGDKPSRILFAFGLICAGISMWISNTATTAMMFPIGLGIIHTLADVISKTTGKTADPKRIRFATGMMLMAAYASSAGGIGTPVGTPPNLIGLAMIDKFAKVRIPFFQWLLFAVPILVVMYLLLYFLMYLLHKPETVHVEGCREYIRQALARLGSWKRGEKNALIAFLVAVTLWIIPGFLAVLFGTQSAPAQFYNSRIPESSAALLAALLLFLLPIDWKKREFTISWREAVQIDWGTLLLFGGGLSLGELMFKTKLAEAIGEGILEKAGIHSVWGLTLAAIYISIFVSEATSNTASANMVVPVIISVSLAAGINPLPAALGATLGASWGFMLPVSTPPNAIVYGSGMVPITRMLRAGLIFDILGGLLLWLGLRLLLPLVGLA
jgi:sodium-dependent dicarboxylate transporter 2/3/5